MPEFKPKSIAPYWQTTDGQTAKLFLGDTIEVMKRLPAESVQCVVTSPPYWALRDYGTGEWVGGDENCSHEFGDNKARPDRYGKAGVNGKVDVSGGPSRDVTQSAIKRCSKCGAKRVGDNQIGSEETVEVFANKMVEVFNEVHRVLRDDGTCWIDIGDTYLDGHLTGAPWKMAFALVEAGWVLRQDIIWHKVNPMPESCTNRCTKAHEYLFLMTKRKGDYFYDCDAIREQTDNTPTEEYYDMLRINGGWNDDEIPDKNVHHKQGVWLTRLTHPNGRNKRSVWSVASEAYPGAHFATFPQKLIEPCILAGTSEYGACVDCGAPWKRVTERTALKRNRPNDYVKYADTSHEKKNRCENGQKPQGGWDKLRAEDKARRSGVNSCANSVAGVDVKTLGWEKTCQCETDEVRPCTVLDPFCGTATTCCVAIKHGRSGWGIDLSEKYLMENAIIRIEGELLSRPSTRHLAGKKTKRVSLGEACD